MNLFARLRGKAPEKRYSMTDYMQDLANQGGYFSTVSAHSETESIENSFVGYASLFKRNSVVFSAMSKRAKIFSEARFQFQKLDKGRPGDLRDDPSLRLLETPWPNGTTGELLSRMIQDADLAGNAYVVRESPTRLRRLRPDWVTIVLTAAPAVAVQSDVKGYIYHPGGVGSAAEVEPYTVDEMVHWCPETDPEAQYRGMSWLSPIIREIQADNSATEHKLKFFDNGAQLQTVLTLGDSVTKEQFGKWVQKFREAHQGTRNAYEPLFLGGGADAKVIGTDLKQLDFKAVTGAGETRIASASGLNAVILAFSEGMQGSSLNAGNFAASRRLAADTCLRPLWRSAASALASVIKVPSGSRLWYDDRDISFLREDMKDLADIQSTEGQTIRTLVDAGYTPDSVTAAVIAQDWSSLRHTGTYSVQLQPPGGTGPAASPEGDPPSDDKPTEAEAKAESAARILQQTYLAVGITITVDEARKLVNDMAGTALVIPAPDELQTKTEPESEPVPIGEPPVSDEPTEEPSGTPVPDDEEEQDV